MNKEYISDQTHEAVQHAIDMVNHPKHYETGKFECIEVMQEVFGKGAVEDFCLCNAFKYLYRCTNKSDMIQDIEKARWYIDKFLELERADDVAGTHEAAME